MRTQWPHAKLNEIGERREVSLFAQQPTGTRYVPAERSETLPRSYESETAFSELVY